MWDASWVGGWVRRLGLDWIGWRGEGGSTFWIYSSSGWNGYIPSAAMPNPLALCVLDPFCRLAVCNCDGEEDSSSSSGERRYVREMNMR